MREVAGSNPIGDNVFFGGNTCSTVTLASNLNNPRWSEQENWSGCMMEFEISSSKYDDF